MTLTEAIKRLEAAGIEDAAYDARALFRTFGGYCAAEPLPYSAKSDSFELERAIARREGREPLQYIIGSVGFFREEYKVTPDVLIPRPDTEHLVELAVKEIPDGESFIDLCTGSGCIAISTLNNTKNTRAVAVDISPAALAVAKENAARIGVSDRLTLVLCDLLSDADRIDGEYYAVLSNPPYVTEAAYSALAPEIYNEPACAFVGGEDGGDFYRALVPLAARLVKPEGFIAMEIGYDQREMITEIAEENRLSCEIIRDYSGNDRVALMRRAL